MSLLVGIQDVFGGISFHLIYFSLQNELLTAAWNGDDKSVKSEKEQESCTLEN